MKKRYLMKSFDYYWVYCPNGYIWNKYKRKLVKDWDKINTCSTAIMCHSLRAFRRRLRQITIKQPEFIGTKFTLVAKTMAPWRKDRCLDVTYTAKHKRRHNERT